MDSSIEKRVLGKSNLKVSRMCYGTLAFSIYHARIVPEIASDLLKKAYNKGVNFWDTAELYETYEHINFALKKLDYPEDIVISSRSYASTFEEMEISINNCLKVLDKSQVEIFGLHEVQIEEYKNGYFRPEAMNALIEAKNKGLIKAISLTTHSAKVTSMAAGIPEIDVIMPLINHKAIGIKDGSLSDMVKAISKAKSNNKGIFAMKVLAGGLFTDQVTTSINYALNNPNIDSIAIGMSNEKEIEFNISVFQGIQQKETEHKTKKQILVEPWCIGCGNCIKACPQGAISLEFGQANVNHEACVRCGYCIPECKDFYLKFLNL